MDCAIAGAVSHLRDATEDSVRCNILMNPDMTEREKGIRKTLLILSAIALAFYLGFILMGVLQA
jgi:hypothetical protein